MIWGGRTITTDQGHRDSSIKQYTTPSSARNQATGDPGHTEKQIHLATTNSYEQSVTFQKAGGREMTRQLLLLTNTYETKP